jgi:SAM-dependent methyltransferase
VATIQPLLDAEIEDFARICGTVSLFYQFVESSNLTSIDNPARPDKPKPPSKTLVVGSPGHAHVACVAWTDLKSVNLKDFDAIVFNVASLDDETILRLPDYGFFKDVRKELARLLKSGGRIIALTPEKRSIKQKDDWRTNWEWCPFNIETQPEAGDTIEIKRAVFDSYLSKLKRWTFYYFVPRQALTYEMTDVFGNPASINYNLSTVEYAVNRYGMMLAGEVPIMISLPSGQNSIFGSVTVLPHFTELEQKDAMNLILEDLLGRPQKQLPPDWASQISMPFVIEIKAEIEQKNVAIESLRQEIAASELKCAEIEKWKKLVYETGHELENIFEAAIIKLGAETHPAIAEEEFIFDHKGKAGVVECKGVTKSVSLDHLRQADSHVLKFAETENHEGKGVLFGNAWRNLALSARGSGERPIFPDNVVKQAAKREIALVSACDFLEVFCRFLKGEVSGEAILDAIVAQNGIVDFRELE